MEIVKAFNENNMHSNIVIKGTYDEPLFRASDIGEILEMTNIRATVQNFDSSEKVVNSIDTLGGYQNMIFLTEKGLYKVLFKSRKPIAEKFQNWVCEVIKEIRLNGIYDLQKQLEIQKLELSQLEDKKKKEYNIQLEKEKVLEREKILLKEYGTIGSIVYIIKVKTFHNGNYIVKIGESRKGIIDRYKEHKNKYEECLLLDCFAVNKSKEFESLLHNHSQIRGNKVNDLKGHQNEMELFLIGKNLSYFQLLNIINTNIPQYQYNIIELINENEKLKFQVDNPNFKSLGESNIIEELLNHVKQLSSKIDNLEKTNKEILEKINSSQTKITTGFDKPLVTLGPRLQKINPETLQLIKVYETVTEAMKENSNIKRPSINKAITENTIYLGYRWLLVDRELDPKIIYYIEPTKQTKTQNLGYIAQLNPEKTEIINVYIDRKTACQFNGFQSSSALDNAVKNYILAKGYYYKLYDECENELKSIFEKKINGIPILYKNGVGQFDLQDNLIKEFICKYDCIKQLNMSDKTLTKALDNNISYNGYYYKNLNSKLKC
jgi:prophage antirepressor-like protein